MQISQIRQKLNCLLIIINVLVFVKKKFISSTENTTHSAIYYIPPFKDIFARDLIIFVLKHKVKIEVIIV